MPRKLRKLVFNTWSLLAYFGDEPASERVADLIAQAHEHGASMMMSAITAGEVWCLIARGSSATQADHAVLELGQLGIEIQEVDWKNAREAANFKSHHRMSLADSFALALARQKKADLVTGDPEFKKVEGEVRIIWLG